MRCLHRSLSAAFLTVTLATLPVATPAVADDDWTVLMMAPDGSWGAATNFSVNRAIATAITNCKAAYQREIGCGAIITTIRAGWSLWEFGVAAKIFWWPKRRWLMRNRPLAIARWSYGGTTCATCRHAGA